MRKGIKSAKGTQMHTCEGGYCKVTKFVGSHVFFVFFFLLAIKRCPHVLTTNAYTDFIVL